MAERNERETGARKLEPLTGPDPRDAFSQDAATNRQPPLGEGLTEKIDIERSETDKSDFQDSSSAAAPASDAKGQAEDNDAGGTNDGVSSANPRVLSGDESGDATFPLKRPL